MEILEGLFFINDLDAYNTYGVFLSEENPGDMENYNSLMKPAESKGHTCVDFREHDGEKYPDKLVTALKSRDIELRFTLEADDKDRRVADIEACGHWPVLQGVLCQLQQLDTTYRIRR